MADGGEDDVGGIAVAALEMAAAEVSIGLHATDHGLDGGAAPELAFDHPEDATLLAGDEDASRVFRFVTAIALVDIGALDRASGERLGGFDDVAERMAVVGIARQRLGVHHELTAPLPERGRPQLEIAFGAFLLLIAVRFVASLA